MSRLQEQLHSSSCKVAIALITARISVDRVDALLRYVDVVAFHDRATDLVQIYDRLEGLLSTTHVHHLRNIRHVVAYQTKYTHFVFVDDDDYVDLTCLRELSSEVICLDALYLICYNIQPGNLSTLKDKLRRTPAWWMRFTPRSAILADPSDRGVVRRRGEDKRFVEHFISQQSNDALLKSIVSPTRFYAYNFSLRSLCSDDPDIARPQIRRNPDNISAGMIQLLNI